ncbi:hypothetical protein VKT23_006358 [Stygiomarasmius scandens]|uniref:Uncharacterized protein n=1 Tax=Marasmiellus scandens TaxID=2682957 RepID=A0ABR1JPM0_9AGAR
MVPSSWWYLTQFPLSEHIGWKASPPALSFLPKCLHRSRSQEVILDFEGPPALSPFVPDIDIVTNEEVEMVDHSGTTVNLETMNGDMIALLTGQTPNASPKITPPAMVDVEHRISVSDQIVEENLICLKQNAATAISPELAKVLACTDPPPHVPAPLICFLSAHHINLLSFRVFMHHVLRLFPVEIFITRIWAVPNERGNHFIIKAKDNTSAARLWRAFIGTPLCNGYCLLVSLVQISEWRLIMQQDAEEWGIQNPLLPTFHETKAFMIQHSNS